jgi:DnaK suppressor protein
MTKGKVKGAQRTPKRKKPLKGGQKTPAQKGKTSPTAKRPRVKRQEKDFKSAFLQSLLTKKDELEKNLTLLRNCQREYGGQLTAGDFIDEVDDAQREISTHKLYSLIERKNRELRNIDRLITRIAKEEDFGICEECGKRIPRERLLVIPEAVLCVACQRELETMDSKRGPAARTSGPFTGRKDMEWGGSEAGDDGADAMVEYQIGSLPDMDMDDLDAETDGETKGVSGDE